MPTNDDDCPNSTTGGQDFAAPKVTVRGDDMGGPPLHGQRYFLGIDFGTEDSVIVGGRLREDGMLVLDFIENDGPAYDAGRGALVTSYGQSMGVEMIISGGASDATGQRGRDALPPWPTALPTITGTGRLTLHEANAFAGYALVQAMSAGGFGADELRQVVEDAPRLGRRARRRAAARARAAAKGQSKR